eukprot:1263571-Pleurochrysis_carterae.AAC.2
MQGARTSLSRPRKLVLDLVKVVTVGSRCTRPAAYPLDAIQTRRIAAAFRGSEVCEEKCSLARAESRRLHKRAQTRKLGLRHANIVHASVARQVAHCHSARMGVEARMSFAYGLRRHLRTQRWRKRRALQSSGTRLSDKLIKLIHVMLGCKSEIRLDPHRPGPGCWCQAPDLGVLTCLQAASML